MQASAYKTLPATHPGYSPDLARQISRTPSPTPSEQEILDSDGKPHPADMFKPKNFKTLLITVILVALGVVMYIFQNQLVNDLKPVAAWMHAQPAGFLIPIAVMLVMSFPPLFGQEIVIVLVGFTWGLPVGFAIAAAGTIFGELASFFVFKFFCGARGRKAEEKDVSYACLATAVREGGIVIATIARYSTIPSHITTVIFSFCGMRVTTYLVAAVLSLPKQFATVYLGYALQFSSPEQKLAHHTKLVQFLIIGVTTLVTIAASRYIRLKKHAVREAVVYARRKHRQAGCAGQLDADSERGAAYPVYPPPAMAESQIHAPQPRPYQ